jgi:hypothetical protein
MYVTFDFDLQKFGLIFAVSPLIRQGKKLNGPWQAFYLNSLITILKPQQCGFFYSTQYPGSRKKGTNLPIPAGK